MMLCSYFGSCLGNLPQLSSLEAIVKAAAVPGSKVAAAAAAAVVCW
jgi:hypothetical protein